MASISYLCLRYNGSLYQIGGTYSQSQYSREFHVFSESSDINHDIYLMATFMAVFQVYPEAIIQGWLL